MDASRLKQGIIWMQQNSIASAINCATKMTLEELISGERETRSPLTPIFAPLNQPIDEAAAARPAKQANMYYL